MSGSLAAARGARSTSYVRPDRWSSRWRQPHQAATCAPHVGPAATVRDGSRSAVTAGRSRHGEHPGARVTMAETLMGGACQQPRFAGSDVRRSRQMNA